MGGVGDRGAVSPTFSFAWMAADDECFGVFWVVQDVHLGGLCPHAQQARVLRSLVDIF